MFFHISVPPQIVPIELGAEKFNTGDMVSLTCTVNKGDLPLKITWTLNGKTVDEVQGVIVNLVGVRRSYLNIDNIDAEHAGEYVCHARNSAGVTSYSVELQVNGNSILFPFLIAILHAFSKLLTIFDLFQYNRI